MSGFLISDLFGLVGGRDTVRQPLEAQMPAFADITAAWLIERDN